MMAALRRSLKRMSRSKSQRRSAKKTRKLKRGTKKSPRKGGKSKGKNEFMTRRNAALRTGKRSFTYCGKPYKKGTLKTGLETYKRA